MAKTRAPRAPRKAKSLTYAIIVQESYVVSEEDTSYSVLHYYFANKTSAKSTYSSIVDAVYKAVEDSGDGPPITVKEHSQTPKVFQSRQTCLGAPYSLEKLVVSRYEGDNRATVVQVLLVAIEQFRVFSQKVVDSATERILGLEDVPF